MLCAALAGCGKKEATTDESVEQAVEVEENEEVAEITEEVEDFSPENMVVPCAEGFTNFTMSIVTETYAEGDEGNVSTETATYMTDDKAGYYMSDNEDMGDESYFDYIGQKDYNKSWCIEGEEKTEEPWELLTTQLIGDEVSLNYIMNNWLEKDFTKLTSQNWQFVKEENGTLFFESAGGQSLHNDVNFGESQMLFSDTEYLIGVEASTKMLLSVEEKVKCTIPYDDTAFIMYYCDKYEFTNIGSTKVEVPEGLELSDEVVSVGETYEVLILHDGSTAEEAYYKTSPNGEWILITSEEWLPGDGYSVDAEITGYLAIKKVINGEEHIAETTNMKVGVSWSTFDGVYSESEPIENPTMVVLCTSNDSIWDVEWN